MQTANSYKQFRDWITKNGTTQVAAKLKIERTTVSHWRRGHSVPRPQQMHAIQVWTRGKITYAMMIENYLVAHPVKTARKKARK